MTTRKKILRKRRPKTVRTKDNQSTVGEKINGDTEEVVQGKLSPVVTSENWSDIWIKLNASPELDTNVTVAISHTLDDGKVNKDVQPVVEPVDLSVKDDNAGNNAPSVCAVHGERMNESFSTEYGTGPDPSQTISKLNVVEERDSELVASTSMQYVVPTSGDDDGVIPKIKSEVKDEVKEETVHNHSLNTNGNDNDTNYSQPMSESTQRTYQFSYLQRYQRLVSVCNFDRYILCHMLS